jgi:hypothetical protein
MVLKPGNAVLAQGPRRHLHAFVKRRPLDEDGEGVTSLRSYGLNVDDYVVVSSCDGKFLALAAGGVDSIAHDEIIVALDRSASQNSSREEDKRMFAIFQTLYKTLRSSSYVASFNETLKTFFSCFQNHPHALET